MECSNFGISAIIPFYKGNKFIKNTLDSLSMGLIYSKLPYEIIIINDSPNEKIEVDLSNYKNVSVYINDKNRGIAYSRNRGKNISCYKYLYFIDQDDWIDKNFFCEAKNHLELNFDAVIFNYICVKENNKKTNYNFLFKKYFSFITAGSLIKYGNVFRTTGQVIIKKDSLNDFIETDTMGSDDAYMFIDLFFYKDTHKFLYIEKPLFYYRIHLDNYTKKTNFHKSSLECFEKYESVNQEITKYKKYLIRRYSGDLLLNFISKLLIKSVTFRIIN